MPKLVNAYTVRPSEIEVGDVMLFIVKAMVMYRGLQGQLRYRLYRCPWDGKLEDVPQGSQVLSEAIVCHEIFPTLAQVAAPG